LWSWWPRRADVTGFSSRLPPHTDTNALSRRVETLRASGIAFVDLTESNPTRVGLPYPDDLLAPLGDPRALRYEPSAVGLSSAREAIAADCARRGARIEPSQVVLSASTSESYTWLFKLLCDAGDAVLVPRPSYPLFEHLTRLELVEAIPYDLEYHGRWEIDFTRLEAAPARTRAILVVSPNNPTGSFVSAAEVDRLTDLCRRHRWALIVDEVFADYTLDTTRPVTDIAARGDALAFTLGGASKSLGLPQLKLGWTIVGGPPAERAAAVAGLELIADTFLSVGTPVQAAAATLLETAAPVRNAIHDRVRGNLTRARQLAAGYRSCDVLPVEGGWSAVLRVPATRPEEQLVLELLDRAHVLVHPGYFFDFPREAYVVVSLLPPPAEFTAALTRVLQFTHL
jgi:aspartate/methionine/tyrosine aminotransferase